MDTTSPQPATSTPPANSQPPVPPGPEKKHGSSKIVKIALLVVLGTLLLSGGYYFGTQTTKPEEKMVPQTAPTATPTESLPSPTITTTSQKTKTVKGGLSGETSFKPYTIQVPEGWVDAHETTVAASIDKLTLTKNGYSLIIYQAAVGGGGCLYPGDKPTEMASTFTDFAPITATDAQFRRSWNLPENGAKVISYTICQKAPDNSYGNVTGFGVINAVSPNPANAVVLAEIDNMLASLKKE